MSKDYSDNYFDIGSMGCRCQNCGCKNTKPNRVCEKCGYDIGDFGDKVVVFKGKATKAIVTQQLSAYDKLLQHQLAQWKNIKSAGVAHQSKPLVDDTIEAIEWLIPQINYLIADITENYECEV